MLWNYRARVLRVHDGDTVTVLADLGFSVRAEQDIRLVDVWAPELGKPGGSESRDHLIAMLDAIARQDSRNDWPLLLRSQPDVRAGAERRSFTRYLGILTPLNLELSTLKTTVNDAMKVWLVQQGWTNVNLAQGLP